ncbi:GDSL esterase/lipase At5g33370-like isoform X3 [Triticum dicoccoides]|uniref:GDSL esterase/lipase n=1 Tax=Triticum aestivum TaxID=4565 RepID=A0A3B6SV30_WHEAT|nr:GDSL esterase/lipase At5g33370-like isoform X3 [Triticum dicoccoides]XP_044435521.1 GDSL esterase/lipase At5g33370-like [Triticum aestivum]
MARSIALVCFLVVGLGLLGAMCASAAAAGGENGGRLVNAVYVFGDSLVDVGNNDYLPAPAPRANRPYGMDLPGKPTGRFTNGYNLADVISQRVGFEMSPKPYLSMLPHDKILLGLCKIGANYASGGSGILDTTGKGTLTMRTQVEYFKKAADNMICYPSKEEHLSRSLFLLSGGGNDFSAFDPSSASPQAYVVKMVTTYIEHIQALYDMGARMVGILDVPPIGCTPGQRIDMPNGECNEQANSLAQAFNGLLRAKLAEAAAANMKELKYSIAANYNILNDMMANSLVAGLRQVKTACCGSGKLNAEVMCSHQGTTACPAAEHDDYMFWDMLHPTHATIQRGVVALFYGNGPKYGEPVNFGTLVTGQNVSPAIKMVVDEQ